jgi:RNA polymerase sigma-70 factor (ECF subfamily)
MDGTERFEAFVRRYQDMVFGTAVRLLGNATEAEDVAQSVFLKAFQRFGDIGDSPSAAGWLKTVVRNACLNHLTRYRPRWRLFSEMDPTGRGEAFEPDLEGVLSTRRRESRRRLRRKSLKSPLIRLRRASTPIRTRRRSLGPSRRPGGVRCCGSAATTGSRRVRPFARSW